MPELRSAAPSLACVINNYNYENYLAQAIESAISQTVRFRQIIVVDDGSTDGSDKVITTFGLQIKVIETANRGQTAACLTALASVETEYVLFLDADDYLKNSLVDEVSQALQGHKHPVKIQYQLVTIDDEGRQWGCFPTYPEPYMAEDMRRENEEVGFYRSPPTTGNVFRTDALRRFDSSRLNPRGAIDGTLNLLMPYAGEIVSLSKPLAFKREHQRSMSAWSAPSVELLEKEIRTFKETWAEACALMNWPQRDFDHKPPLYLLERSVMLSARAGRPMLGATRKYVRALLRQRPTRRESLALSAWALSLAGVPLAGWREWAVKARRSPVNRGGKIDNALRLVLRKARRT